MVQVSFAVAESETVAECCGDGFLKGSRPLLQGREEDRGFSAALPRSDYQKGVFLGWKVF